MRLFNRNIASLLLKLWSGLFCLVGPLIANAQNHNVNQPVKQPIKVYAFQVLLDSKPIGTHRFEVTDTQGGVQSIRSDASFDVRFLGIPFYRYRHTANEQWQSGCLKQLQSTTHDNGKDVSVRAVDESGRMRVTRDKQNVELNGCISTYAYWNPALLRQQNQLLNPQTGAIDKVRVELMGEESVVIGGVQSIADRLRIRGDAGDIHLWYSKAGEWLQLESVTGERRIRYRVDK
jgi:hypothetical protein